MIFTGGMSDPYVHLEQKLGLTKAMLNLIDAHHFPVSILTKSDMLLRDLTLLKRINQKTKAVVCFTITTFDDALCLKLEPHVCPTSKRLEALRQCHEAGITTGIWLTPILPFINDTETNIKAIVQAAHDVGVSFIINFGMGTTMRAGSREPFYENLDRLFPGMKLKYQKTFGNHYVCPSPKATQLETVFRAACDERNILYKNKDIQQLLTPKTPTQLSLFEE